MDLIYFLVQQMMYFAIPLLVVALGGMFSEKSGVINIGLEGIMVLGGFTSILFISIYQDRFQGQPILIVGLIIAAITGVLISLVHAFASINMRANQSISGTAINMFAPAFAIYLTRVVKKVQQIPFENQFRIEKIPLLGDIPVIGDLFFKNTYITTYLGLLILILSGLVLYKTKYGLRLQATGENPQAADSVGINVYKIRYSAVMISGALAGMGGLIYFIPTSTSYNATVAGYGFLALAVLIFGQWKPSRVFLAALFFGIMKTIGSAYSGIPILANIGIPNDIYKMIPYIATLIVLAISSQGANAPKAIGVPYDKGGR